MDDVFIELLYNSNCIDVWGRGRGREENKYANIVSPIENDLLLSIFTIRFYSTRALSLPLLSSLKKGFEAFSIVF